MKSITIYIFVTLGIIFLVLIIVGSYLFFADPYGLREVWTPTPSTVVSESSIQSTVNTSTSTEPDVPVVRGFELSNAQVEALVSLGIDPAVVPSSINAEQEVCFVGALGEVRVGEIKAGDVPSALEFLKAKSCI